MKRRRRKKKSQASPGEFEEDDADDLEVDVVDGASRMG